jgi:hypothetical protein
MGGEARDQARGVTEASTQVLQPRYVGGVWPFGERAVGFGGNSRVKGGPDFSCVGRALKVVNDGLKERAQALRRVVGDAEGDESVGVEGGVFTEHTLGDFAEHQGAGCFLNVSGG